jgi:hypothetical protein
MAAVFAAFSNNTFDFHAAMTANYADKFGAIGRQIRHYLAELFRNIPS